MKIICFGNNNGTRAAEEVGAMSPKNQASLSETNHQNDVEDPLREDRGESTKVNEDTEEEIKVKEILGNQKQTESQELGSYG